MSLRGAFAQPTRMSFLQDYLLYNANNECPRNYHLWSALAVLSAVVSRRVYIDQGFFEIRPNLYICLVGKQGNRKSTAKDIARDLVMETCPKIPLCASVISKEKICQKLAEDDSTRTYKDEKGVIVEYKPYVMFINELKNFLSINPAGMIDFLTDIYDRKVYAVETKNKGSDFIPNPHIVILACETPDWIIDNMKYKVISGGFCRRMIFVYEVDRGERIPFPSISTEGAAAWIRVKKFIDELRKVSGKFEWEEEARQWFSDWYKPLKLPDDPILAGFYETKHIQLLKVAMLVALCDGPPFVLVLKKVHLEVALAMLDAAETHMPKLSQGIGRNELAYPTAKLMELIQAHGGIIEEKQALRFAGRDMTNQEIQSVLAHLRQTDQIVCGDMKRGEISRKVIMTHAYWQEHQKKQQEKK
jgi:hypothetical protein